MNPSNAIPLRSTHPLSGLEAWPKTGPVYGFADDEQPSPSRTLWQRLGERLRKAPSADSLPMPQARIWY
jgi:hypothetical protein